MCFTRNQRRGELLEVVIEWLIVQEDPVVMIVPVEAVLNLPDGFGDFPDIGVAGQSDKRGIHAFSCRNRRTLGAVSDRIPFRR